MNAHDMFVGGLVALAAVALLVLGRITGDAWIVDDCHTFGKFKVGGTVYECKKATPETVSEVQK